MSQLIHSIQNLFLDDLGKTNLLGKIILAVLIYAVMKIVLLIINKALRRFSSHKFPKVPESKKITVFSALNSFVKFIIYFIAITFILDLFGINTSSIIATAGIGGIAIALGAQTLVKDILSGLFILLEDQFNIGDYLTIGSVTGTVEEIGLRKIKVRDDDGSITLIPNSLVQQVTNYSTHPIKINVKFPVPYAIKPDEIGAMIEKISEECRKEVDYFTAAPALSGIDSLADSNYTVQVAAETISGNQGAGQQWIKQKILKEIQDHGIFSAAVDENSEKAQQP